MNKREDLVNVSEESYEVMPVKIWKKQSWGLWERRRCVIRLRAFRIPTPASIVPEEFHSVVDAGSFRGVGLGYPVS